MKACHLGDEGTCMLAIVSYPIGVNEHLTSRSRSVLTSHRNLAYSEIVGWDILSDPPLSTLKHGL